MYIYIYIYMYIYIYIYIYFRWDFEISIKPVKPKIRKSKECKISETNPNESLASDSLKYNH